MSLLRFFKRGKLKPSNTPARIELEQSPKEKFQLILELANEVMEASRSNKCIPGTHPLVDLIRLIGRDIQTKYLTRMLYRTKDDASENLSPDSMFFNEYRTYICLAPEPIRFDEIKIRLENHRTVRLSRDLILPWPWRRSRLVNCFSSIGPGRVNGCWKQDYDNHIVELWLPMGIAWVRNGNHSIATGIIQGEGIIVPHYTYDISKVYQYVDCDGDNYIRKKDKSIIEPVCNVEMAAVFEIGRLMHNKSISF